MSRRRAAAGLNLLGLVALASVGALVWLGLWATPPDQFMGNLVRLIYVHPPVAWVAYLAFGVSAAASLLYLWPRTRTLAWDRLAGASAEVGVVFCALTLVSGSIWGRPTWGVWWTWDARLTSTALLFVLYLGYLALRRVPAGTEARGLRAAVACLVAFADVPISYLSVYWWRSLHQTGTVLDPEQQTHIHGSMAWTLLLGFCAFTLVYVWMVAHRYRLAALEEQAEQAVVEAALAERRSEAGPEVVRPAPEPDRGPLVRS
jgi:heme exporter protein C